MYAQVSVPNWPMVRVLCLGLKAAEYTIYYLAWPLGKDSAMDRRYDTSAAVSELSTRVNLLRTVYGMWICGSKSSPALHAIVDNVAEAWDDRGSCVRSVGMHLRPGVGNDARCT